VGWERHIVGTGGHTRSVAEKISSTGERWVFIDETFTCTTARRNSLGETHIAQRKLNRTGGAAENEDAVDTITAGFDFAV